MRSILRGALGFLTWLAVLWTIYEEQRHLALYFGTRDIAFGAAEYVDVAVTLVLLGYAIYEVFHFLGRTRRLDHYLADHPAIDALTVVLVAALGWGIYRDLGHFQHLYLDENGAFALGDDFDQLAAVLLVLGVIKTGYHALHALHALGRLSKRV